MALMTDMPLIPDPEPTSVSGLRCLAWPGQAMSGPTLVFLHGIGDGADMWRPVIGALPNHLYRRALAFDLPGHGGSDGLAPNGYTLMNMVNRTAEAINASGATSTILIGHSLGARITTRLAGGLVAHERSVLVDLDPNAGDGSAGNSIEDHLKVLMAGSYSMPTFARLVASKLPLCDPKVVADVLPHLAKASAKTGHAFPRISLDPNITGLLQKRERIGTWDALKKMTAPVGLIRGQFSGVLDKETAQEMGQSVTLAGPIETIDMAGHAIALENPTGLAHALARLIGSASHG